MPNHISNRVQIKSLNDDWRKEEEAFKQLEALMKTKESPFDFNVLIPYPEQYSILDKARNGLICQKMDSIRAAMNGVEIIGGRNGTPMI